MFVRFRTAIAPALVALLLAAPGFASLKTFEIKDIGSFGDSLASGASQNSKLRTFSGDGLIGVARYHFNELFSADLIAHFLGVLLPDERTPVATVMQVGIGELKGKVIQNALLEFDLRLGSGTASATVTSIDADGELGFVWDPPDDLGSVTQEIGLGVGNQIDVTQLLKDRLSSGEDWFGMFLKAPGTGLLLTVTYPGLGFEADSAKARLIVEYSDGLPATGVDGHQPEPSALAIWSVLGAILFVGHRRIRRGWK